MNIDTMESKTSKTSKTSNNSYVNMKTENGLKMEFNLINTNFSVANALRRTILSDIPAVVFKTFPHNENLTTIHKNTSRLNNEILRQRLECIPIHIKDLSINFDELQIELNMKNTTDTVLNVTTGDFKIKDLRSDTYLTEEAIRSIFPADPFTKDFIIFCRLRPKISNDIPGEEISFTSKLSIHTAFESGAYNVSSKCAYAFTEDKVKQDDVWQKKLASLTAEEKNPENLEYIKKDWENHEAKRIYKKDCFDFKLESVGVFSCYELVSKACEIIISKLNSLHDKAGELNIPIEKSKSTMPWSFDITLKNESYTIGKVIEYILNKKYFKESNILKFVGFRQDHPHDTDSFIRISFNPDSSDAGEPSTEIFKTATYTLIQEACKEGMEIFNEIAKEFN